MTTTTITLIEVRAEWGCTHNYIVAEIRDEDGEVKHSLKNRVSQSLPTRGIEFEAACNEASDRLADKLGLSWEDVETSIA